MTESRSSAARRLASTGVHADAFVQEALRKPAQVEVLRNLLSEVARRA